MNTEQLIEYTTIIMTPLLLLIFWRDRNIINLGWSNMFSQPNTVFLVIITLMQLALEMIINYWVSYAEERQDRRVSEMSSNNQRIFLVICWNFLIKFSKFSIKNISRDLISEKVVEWWKPQRRKKSIAIYLFYFFIFSYAFIYFRHALPTIFYCSRWNVCTCTPIFLMFSAYCNSS